MTPAPQILKLVLAVWSLVYLLLLTLLLFFLPLPDGPAKDILEGITGAALMLAKDAFSFVFGSSQGSEDKNAQITQLAAVAANSPAPQGAP
jgi:hypothetical protein